MSLHLSGPEVEQAIADAQLALQAAHVAPVATTGVVHPANVAYTQADQTALSACVLALAAALNGLLTAMTAAGSLAAS